MKKNNLKIGIIGFGAMGKTHAYAVQNLPFFFGNLPFRATVEGVVTRSLEKSQAICDTYGIPLALTNEDDLINNPEIDAIDICTPNILHYETAKKALLAGKHVYCEKPLCDTYEKAGELAQLAKSRCLVNMTVFNNRHLTAVIRAKQLIDEGRLGRILHFDMQYLHNSCIDPDRTVGWKQNSDVCGEGGVLFDLGSHVLDLAVFLCGKVKTISAKSQIAYPTHKTSSGDDWQTNAPEAFYMMTTTTEGATGMITASKLTSGACDDLRFAIYGERGSVRFSLMQPNFLEFYDATVSDKPQGGTRGYTQIECVGRAPAPGGVFPAPKAPVGWLTGHVMSMGRFLEAVYHGTEADPDFESAAYVQYLMDVALRADKQGRSLEVTL
ncbi:MAG: Gfo/Idh/MocA family oxidoreductase [Ruminococcaceae bacterium]|nr:Gfo/Idh/MocA family oxidoreductase [Oscillospiraceae bacterium]